MSFIAFLPQGCLLLFFFHILHVGPPRALPKGNTRRLGCCIFCEHSAQNNVQRSGRTTCSGKRCCVDMMISLPWGKRLIRLGPRAETSLYKIAHLCGLSCKHSVAGHPADRFACDDDPDGTVRHWTHGCVKDQFPHPGAPKKPARFTKGPRGVLAFVGVALR
jgi:hypothetical protein